MKTQSTLRVTFAVVLAVFLLLLSLTSVSGQSNNNILLFDDFTGTTLNTDLWFFGTNSWGSGYSLGDGILNIWGGYQPGGGGWVRSQQLFNVTQETRTFEARVRVSSGDGGAWGFWEPASNGERTVLFSNAKSPGAPSSALLILIYSAPYLKEIPLPDVDTTGWHTYRMEFTENVAKFYVDDALKTIATEGLPVGKQMAIVLDRVSWGANQFIYVDYVRLISGVPTLRVNIDIKPNSLPNSINSLSNGEIPVAILSTQHFDATTVDPLSVSFGVRGAFEVHRRGHIEDVDGDGDLDLVMHFRTQDTGIQCGDTSTSLKGKTISGQPIEGSDSISTVGCPTSKPPK